MAIKALAEIPENLQDKRKSYREMIRNDIQEAIDNQIDRFEFEGDYNFKYLATYAREEAYRLFRSKFYYPAKKKFYPGIREKYGARFVHGPSDWEYAERFIKITSRKAEDRTHVYAVIDFEFLEQFENIFCKETEEETQRVVERMRERELEQNGYSRNKEQ